MITEVCLNMHLIYSGLGLAICLQCARWVPWEMGCSSIGWPTAILLVCATGQLPRADLCSGGGWIQWPLEVSLKLDCSVLLLTAANAVQTVHLAGIGETLFSCLKVSPVLRLVAQGCSWGPGLPYTYLGSRNTLVLSCEHSSIVLWSKLPLKAGWT